MTPSAGPPSRPHRGLSCPAHGASTHLPHFFSSRHCTAQGLSKPDFENSAQPWKHVGPAGTRTRHWLYFTHFPPRLAWGAGAGAHRDGGEVEGQSFLCRAPCCPVPSQPVHARPSASWDSRVGGPPASKLRAGTLESVLPSPPDLPLDNDPDFQDVQ